MSADLEHLHAHQVRGFSRRARTRAGVVAGEMCVVRILGGRRGAQRPRLRPCEELLASLCLCLTRPWHTSMHQELSARVRELEERVQVR